MSCCEGQVDWKHFSIIVHNRMYEGYGEKQVTFRIEILVSFEDCYFTEIQGLRPDVVADSYFMSLWSDRTELS